MLVLGYDPGLERAKIKPRGAIVPQKTGVVRTSRSAWRPGFLGTAFDWADVLIVAAWGIGGVLIALRYFHWEPRQA